VQDTGSVFNECTFRRARFNALVHNGTAFVNCTFVSCNFFDSRFTECKLVGSMFDGCQFDHIQVVDGDWSFAGLPGADLRRSDLSALEPEHVRLKGVIITIDKTIVMAEALGLEVRVE